VTAEGDALIAQLVEAVERLAASAEVQVRYLEGLGVAPSADELALELDDAWLAASRGLSDRQRAAVELLDEALRRLSGRENETFWTVVALESDPRWESVRSLARAALAELSGSDQPHGNVVRQVQLSAAQCDYILSAEFVPADVRALVDRAAGAFDTTPPPRAVVLETARVRAEAFRGACTLRLAEVGFDEAYRLTDEGAMLEDLLDAFWGPLG
jgi:hypothetical protein